jgi:hypothetical protein
MNRSNRKPLRPQRRNRRRAALLILACVALASTLILCGLVIDVGNLNVARTELQRASDAAALAAVAAMMEQSDWSAEQSTSLVSYHARNAATEYVALNPCRGVNTMTLPRNDENTPNGDLVLGHYNSTTGVFDPNDTRYNSVYLFLRRDDVQNGPIPLFFGGLVGLRGVNAFGEAAAFSETNINGFHIPSGSEEICQLLPFSLHIDYWPPNPEDYSTAEIKLFPGWSGPAGFEESGNFGTVDLGNPNNSAADLIRQIEKGLNDDDFSFFPDNKIQLDEATGYLWLNGDTGVVAAMRPYIDNIEGHRRIIPLHSETVGQGNTAYFKVVAFAGVEILKNQLNGPLHERHILIRPIEVIDGTVIGGGEDKKTSHFIAGRARLRKIR